MVTDVFTGVASLPLAKHIYNPPWARTLTFLRVQEGVSTLREITLDGRICGSMMFRWLQERIFVIRKNNRNTTLSFGKRST